MCPLFRVRMIGGRAGEPVGSVVVSGRAARTSPWCGFFLFLVGGWWGGGGGGLGGRWCFRGGPPGPRFGVFSWFDLNPFSPPRPAGSHGPGGRGRQGPRLWRARQGLALTAPSTGPA